MNLKKHLTRISVNKENEPRSKETITLAERREHPRHVLELPVDYTMDGKERWGIAADASEGGLLVYLNHVIEKGSLLKIQMFFPRGSELNTVTAMAKVVWSDAVPEKTLGEYRYGLAFQAFQKEGLDKLKNLLETQERYNARP